MSNRLSILILAMLLVTTAGCSGFAPQDEKSSMGDSVIDTSFQYESGEEYVISGTVDIELITNQDATFDDVVLCLYDEEGHLLNATTVGDFSMPGDQHDVRIRTDRRPTFIVLDHPGFRSNDMGAGLEIWREDRPHDVSNLPEEEIDGYSPPTEPGTCGEVG